MRRTTTCCARPRSSASTSAASASTDGAAADETIEHEGETLEASGEELEVEQEEDPELETGEELMAEDFDSDVDPMLDPDDRGGRGGGRH